MALVIDVAMGKVSNSKGSNGGLNLGNALKSITGHDEGVVSLYQTVLEAISGESYFSHEMFGIVRAIAPGTKVPEFVELDVFGKANVKLGSVGFHLLTLDFSEKKAIAERSVEDYKHLTNAGELMNHLFANLALYGKFPTLAQAVNASIGDLDKAKEALLALDTAVDNASSASSKESMVFFVQFGRFHYTDKDGNPIRISVKRTEKDQSGKDVVVKSTVEKQLWIGGKCVVWSSENKESLEKVILSRFVGTSTIEGFTQPELEKVSPATPEAPATPVEAIELIFGKDGSALTIADRDLVDVIADVEAFAKARITEVMKIRVKQERERELALVKSAKATIVNWVEYQIANELK